MVTRTWAELLRRNRATAADAISATIHTAGPAGTRERRLWHAPPDLWRIEDAAGNPERIAGTRWCFDRSGEVMVRSDRFARPAASYSGGPEQLLTLHREWPARVQRTAELQIIEGRSATFSTPDAPEPPYRPAGPIEAATVRGRTGWTVPCVQTASGLLVAWTFDDETGVVIGRDAGGFGAIELADLVVADHFSPAVFGFHGRYVDIAQVRRDAERGLREEDRYRQARGAGNTIERYVGTFAPLLVRTDFSDTASWEAVVGVVTSPTADGDEPDVTLIDNPAYTGWTAARFLDVIDGVPDYILIADSVTMSHPDLPVVFLSTADSGAEWAGRGDRVRVAARSVATVDAVLSIAEQTIAELAGVAGSDGIYR